MAEGFFGPNFLRFVSQAEKEATLVEPAPAELAPFKQATEPETEILKPTPASPDELALSAETPVEAPSDAPVETLASPLPDAGHLPLTLSDVEMMALADSPVIAEAEALVRAAENAAWQAGQRPNPTAGYIASEIGADGGAGQQGMFFGQQIVRGNKRGLDRSVAGHEAQRLREVLAAEQLRVRTDVRTAFVTAYIAQERAKLTSRLATVGKQSAKTSQELLDAEEGKRSDLLLAEIEAERATVDFIQAETRLTGAWRQLTVLVGANELTPTSLAFDVETLLQMDSYDETLLRLITISPEVSAAAATVERARCKLARERAEPISDINAQVSVQHDTSTDETLTGVQLGLRLPLWHQNQGGIGEAHSELSAARHRLEIVERSLRLRLAERYQAYETARSQAVAFRDRVLDRADQNLTLVTSGYGAGEVGFLDVLTAQRTYFRVNLDYLDALSEVARNGQLIEGNLLNGSLEVR